MIDISRVCCAFQLEKTSRSEADDAQRCKARLQHLKDIGTPSRENALDWNRKVLPRNLVDHLLRSGYVETAASLVEAAHLQERCSMLLHIP